MKKFLILFCLVPNISFAQQQSTAAIDRISFSLGQCIKSAEEKVDQLNQVNLQLAQAQAEIKRLKEKYETDNKDSK